MKTQVTIVGGGPAGLLLAHQLHLARIDCVVLEQRSRAYVEARIRAGVLEQGTTDLLRRIGVSDGLDRHGLVHHGVVVSIDGEPLRIDLAQVGKSVTVYGQTEVTRDLIAAAIDRGIDLRFDCADVALRDLDSAAPAVTFRHDDADQRIDCAFVAGCDGFHGVSRTSIPADCIRTFERGYPFGWLGVLADVPPCDPEIVYASDARGFALASMRSPARSRYYIQVPDGEAASDWSDDRFWDELCLRLGAAGAAVVRGPSLEKSVAPLRSFVSEPMRYGRLFLCGDAAHIVPPTGAKGLNLAASDVTYLGEAFAAHARGDESQLCGYSDRALARVWKTVRFSWWFTTLMHRFPDADAFARQMQTSELAYLRGSAIAQAGVAENYVGLPL